MNPDARTNPDSRVKAGKPALNASGIRWLWLSAVIIVLDQLSKLWITSSMQLYAKIQVLPVFDIYRTFNLGAAWSIGENHSGARWMFTGIAVAVSVMLVVWLRSAALATQRQLVLGLALILGGAIGNVIDRVRLGHVIDFLLVHWKDSYFPAFNVADSAICVGAGLVLLDSIREWLRERRAGSSQVEAGGDR